jgi:nitrogenase iron protein NifH
MPDLRQISFYGKGGVGKSTVAANLAACLAEHGLRTMLVGCSPKGDSTSMLLGRMCTPTILHNIRLKGSRLEAVQECIQSGYNGVLCVEAGGPEPASGCAGRGVFHALQLLKKHAIFAKYGVDAAFYDVIADVVCGGFSLPMKDGFASSVFIVTTAEVMSLYAANNICLAVQNINAERAEKIHIGGLIQSCRDIPSESEIVAEFAGEVRVPVVGIIPRSDLVQKAEALKGTVLQRFPQSSLANDFRSLAARVFEAKGVLPAPMPVAGCIDYLGRLMSRHMARQPAGEAILTPLIGDEMLPTHSQTVFSAPPIQLQQSLPRKVSLYGKAGAGKSTISSNLSAALSQRGEKVLQVGCDPKRDSVVYLTHSFVPTILEKISEHEAGGVPGLPELDEVIFPGFNGVWCAEAGGPQPGTGCAGQGVLVALEYLKEKKAVEQYNITFSVYDVLGDVVCGGFAQPIRGGYCQEIYVVTNAEPLSFIVTNNILKAVHKLRKEGVDVGVAGLIHNRRSIAGEDQIVETFAARVGVPVFAHIPRSNTVQQAEALAVTVIEAFPGSSQAAAYDSLAELILRNESIYDPQPLDGSEDLFNLIPQISNTI